MEKTIKKYLMLLLIAIGINTMQAQEYSLEQCVETALVNNKKLKINQNNIRISKAKQQEVKSKKYPKLSAELDYKYFIDQPTQLMPAQAFNPMAPDWQFNPAQFGVPHNINANIQFGIPIYNAQIKNGVEATKIVTQLTELQFQKTKETIYNTIAGLYYNAQVIKNQIDFMDSNISNSTKLWENLKLLKSQQLATGTDVRKMDLQIKQLETQKLLLQSKYQQVINALKINMGVVSEVSFDVTKTINYKKISGYTQQKLTDTKMVETKEELTNNQIKSLKDEQLPSVSLYGSYAQTGYGFDESPNQFLDFYATSFVGVKVAIPILDLSRKLKIKQKTIANENSNLQKELIEDQNTIQVENTNSQLHVATKSIENTLEQIRLATSIYDITLLQHKQEVASLTDVLLADNNLRQTQQNYLSAVIDYLKADLELKRLTGNLFN